MRRSARGRRGRRRFVRLLSHVQIEHDENHQEAASGDTQSLRQPVHPGSWLHVHQVWKFFASEFVDVYKHLLLWPDIFPRCVLWLYFTE